MKALNRIGLPLFALMSLGALPALGQTTLGGLVYDGNGGPLLAGQIYHTTDFTVPAGQTLTIQPGVVIKCGDGALIRVPGTLLAVGSSAGPIRLSSLQDDNLGGDSNGDGGSTQPAPGDWAGIRVETGGTLHLEHVSLRYGGAMPSLAPVTATGGSLRMVRTTIQDARYQGLTLSTNSTVESVRDSSFIDNGTYPVDGLSFAQLENFERIQASGHGTSDAARVTYAFVDTTVAIHRGDYPGDALILTTSHQVRNGGSLTLHKGVVLKSEQFDGLTAQGGGELILAGTAFAPVVLTALEDDQHGGDTNLDGAATAPVPQSSSGFRWISDGNGDAFGRAENAVSRYGSNGFRCDSGQVILRSIRADHANFSGILINDHFGVGTNWVAFGCTTGIELRTSMLLWHATTVLNANSGIRSVSGVTAEVVNSISWANGANLPADNFDLSGLFNVLNSNGYMNGAFGNLFSDPAFVDQAAGDLRLRSDSPCVDAGLNTGHPKDIDEHSRQLDPTLSGVLAPDMGAHERHVWHMDVKGRPTVGSYQAMTVQGPPGASFYFMGFLNGFGLYPPFGYQTCAAPNSRIYLGAQLTNQVFHMKWPYDLALVGEDFGLQTLTLSQADPSRGAWTNLYRDTIQPYQGRKPILLGTPKELTTVVGR